MKRVTVVCLSLVALLAFAGLAIGANFKSTYTGDFDGVSSSAVKLRVGTAGGDAKVRSFFGKDFPVACEGGATAVMKRAGIRGKIAIGNSRRFRAVDDNGQTTIRVVGRAGKRKAKGHFRFFGLMDAGGTMMSCDTGKLFWKAR